MKYLALLAFLGPRAPSQENGFVLFLVPHNLTAELMRAEQNVTVNGLGKEVAGIGN